MLLSRTMCGLLEGSSHVHTRIVCAPSDRRDEAFPCLAAVLVGGTIQQYLPEAWSRFVPHVIPFTEHRRPVLLGAASEHQARPSASADTAVPCVTVYATSSTHRGLLSRLHLHEKKYLQCLSMETPTKDVVPLAI